MRTIKPIALIIFLFASIVASAQTVIPTDSVNNYMGKEVTVKGFVSQVTTLKSGMTYINLDGKYPFTKLIGVIFKKDAEFFTNIKSLDGKTVELTGKIEEYKEKPQIVLKKQEQIQIVE